jgi:hypothetical protein
MIAENQIRERVARYLVGEISLDELEDWLVERSWNMHRDSDEAAQKLAAAIELRLAEHSSGHLSDDGLRKELLRTSLGCTWIGHLRLPSPPRATLLSRWWSRLH